MKRIVKPQAAPAETKPGAPERTCQELNIHEIEVSSGTEKYSPVQYNSFELPSVIVRLGPLHMNDDGTGGETPSELFQRARLMVDGWASLMFYDKLEEHVKRVLASKGK